MKIPTFLILCFASVVLADDFKAIDGKEYKNVTVSRIEPDGIVLKTKSGISKVYFVELPKEVQERFHYNAAIASAYSAHQAVNKATTAIAGRGQPSEVNRTSVKSIISPFENGSRRCIQNTRKKLRLPESSPRCALSFSSSCAKE